jgi:outer membrane cobalamin receptor
MLYRFIAGVALLLGTMVPLDSAAQDPASEEVTMSFQMPDTLVVTASRVSEAVRRTGRRVTVWTADDLATQPVAAFDEALRMAGGVEVQSRAGFGVQSDFTMRGSNFKGVLVLLDGMPLNDPQTAHYLSDFPVPLDAIARIEVLRGPASALYGPDAVGGVVHIITRTGLKSGGSSPTGWDGAAEMQYGAHALYDVNGRARWADGETLVSGATTWQGTDGEAIRGADGTQLTSSSEPLRTDFTRQAHSLALRQSVGERTTWYTRAGMDRRDFNAYHFYTDFDSDRARSDNHTYWLQTRLHGAAGATQWQVQAAAKQHEGLYVYNPMFASSRDYSRMLTSQAHISRLVSPRLTLTGGISSEVRGINSATMGDHQDAAAGAFLTSQWQATDRLTLNGSGRVDYDEAYGWEATPQASIAYTIPVVTLRAAAGRTVRAPTYTERYIDTEVEEPAGNLGNPSLSAERAWSYEAGADLYPTRGASLHATAFYRSTDNLIDYAQRPDEGLFVARNILSAETRGLEIDARAHREIGPAQVRATASYTRLGASLSGVDPSVRTKYALTSARHLVQSTLRAGIGAVTASARGLWKERRQRPSYGVVHGRIAYAVPTWGERLLLSVEVRNLFDTDYSDIFDAPMPGRWWIVGLELRP